MAENNDMKKRITIKTVRQGFIFFAIAGFMTCVCSSLYVLLSYVINGAWDFPNWSLAGFSSLFTLAFLIAGSIFVLYEYQQAQISDEREKAKEKLDKTVIAYNIYEALFQRLTDLEEEASRRWIIKNVKPFGDDETIKTEQEWIDQFMQIIKIGTEKKEDTEQPPEQAHIKRVLNTLDYVGFITKNYTEVNDALMKWMSPPISKMWERLRIYVRHERERRNELDWYDSAEYIGEECIKWHRARFGEPNIVEDTV